MKILAPDVFLAHQQQGIDIIDTRDATDFKTGFIPGAINIPVNKIKEWAGRFVNTDQPILVVAIPYAEQETEELLTQNAHTNIIGCLQGGFDAWKQAGHHTDMIIDVEPDELMMDIPFDDKLVVIDVRNSLEYAQGHLQQAINLPLNEINDPLNIARFDETDNIYLHCGGGSRSIMAASVLKKHGIHNLRNIVGGWVKIKEEPKAEIVKEPAVLN